MTHNHRHPDRTGIALSDAWEALVLDQPAADPEAMAVVRGEADIYVHSGGQYEWDSAAPVAVAQAYGLFCSRLDGSPLVYNCQDVYLPDLIICRPELADAVQAALAEVSAQG